MPERNDLLYKNYSHFSDPVMGLIRKATYGEDIGQNSWVTIEEYDLFISWLRLTSSDHVLEVASGSGGPAHYIAHKASCRVTGIDANESGVAFASSLTADPEVKKRVRFQVADANLPLPFESESFDALMCMDSMNHFPDRLAVFREWHRVLRPGRRAVFTDPVVVTGPVTNEELAQRSSIGLFLFVPPGVNEALIERAGFRLVRQDDVTANAAAVSGRWREAREAHRDRMIEIEGKSRFEELQAFFAAVHRLSRERRLSRVAYLVEK